MKRAWIISLILVSTVLFGFAFKAQADEVRVDVHDRAPAHVVVHHRHHRRYHRVVHVEPEHHEEIRAVVR